MFIYNKKYRFICFIVIAIFAMQAKLCVARSNDNKADEFTVRVLKTSNSKRTILLNRGKEDGFKVNDQAKLFLTSGIVARGVLIKLKNNRSVWSLYRIVRPEFLIENNLFRLKKTVFYSLKSDKVTK